MNSFLLILFLLVAFGCAKQESTSVADAGRGIRNGTLDSGGSAAYPDVVGMYLSGQFHCSAVSLSPRLLLTAGHCVAQFRNSPGNYSVLMGSTPVAVKEVFVHPNFNFGGAVGTVDVAIIELQNFGSAGYSSVAGFGGRDFRRVYTSGDFSRGNSFVAVGLGDSGSGQTGVRRYGEVVFNEYQDALGRNGQGYAKGLLELVPDPDSNTITCLGDSGGPAVLGDQLVGVSSFVSFSGSAYSCGAVHSAHFTDLRAFGEWIDQVRRAQDPDGDCRREGDFRSEDGGCKSQASGKVWSGQARRSYSWNEAVSYCETSSEAGQTDWRLASPDEMRSFFRQAGDDYIAIEGSLFWSANSVNDSAAEAVDLRSGGSSTRGKGEALPVICIRG
ncbi:MAG: trypsin-like serine protease [Bdellovibrionaceae bacterium]|nr:trypsin-like serine protease [Bdellovibrionales bacterium]MCB9255180.1 trypsin-like serine protease [Pseudobdellovibrionaceae bacterium]